MNIRKHAGLDLETDTIIEAACLVSDGSLDTIIEVCHIQVQMSVSAKQEPSAYRIARKMRSYLSLKVFVGRLSPNL